ASRRAEGTQPRLTLASGPAGETLASPRHVHFAAEIAHHLLRWEPGHSPPADVRYEVEYTVYGTNVSWIAIPNCLKISGHSCDLTYYTLDPALRYYARVRAVSENQVSMWTRTNAFSVQEASLSLSGQSLSVTGNSIHVQLQLVLRVGNLTVKYDDIQKHARRYWVYVRRAQDDRTYKVVETSPEFSISNLFWETEYCVSVEPDVATRHVRATRTPEQCVTIGERDRNAELVPSIVSSSVVVVLLLGLLGALLVCTYVRKPVRPPSVLKTFMKQSSLWLEQEASSSGGPDADAVQQLFLCQKEPPPDSGPDGSTGRAPLPPEKGCRLPAWPEDWVCLLGPGAMGSRDSSCTSTDSGISLHTFSSSSSSELSCSSGPEPQGYKRQLPAGYDSSMGSESSRPPPGGSAGSGTASAVEARQPCGGELGLCPAAGQDSQQALAFRGYLQQSHGAVEPGRQPAEGLPVSGRAGPPQRPGSTEVALDIECSELAVAKGYLKQSSPEHPRSHVQDLAGSGAPWQPPAWDFSSPLGLPAPALLSYGAPGAPLASKADPELLKAPFDPSAFDTDLLGTLPLVSSLSTNEWLTLPIDPLSLLSGDSKDSRL
ncbi:I10R1 protein, partial [Podilymbus podiceps]|nr:I10R1 protein [Podilymbus podiceps]